MATLKYWDGSAWQELLGGGGTPGGDSCVICQSGDDIVAKYEEAKLLTPGGAPLSSGNRATLMVFPGAYPLPATWEIDAEFVDVFGLGSVALERGCIVAVNVTGATVNVSANDVRITGLGAEAITPGSGLPFQVFANCVGGDGSFTCVNSPLPTAVSGTFINCAGGDYSFGSRDFGSSAPGTFTNCAGGNFSFGGRGSASSASGTFTNCICDLDGFAAGGEAPGTFTNCTCRGQGFGRDANGTFTNCIGGPGSFGASGAASGIFIRCSVTQGTFPTPTGAGKQRLCIDGNFLEVNAG